MGVPRGKGDQKAAATDESQWFTGYVSTIMNNGRFGFVKSPEAHAIYGDDVFLHSTQLPGLTEGQSVTFRVQLNKMGRPQAVDLVPLETPMPTDGEQWEGTPGTVGGAVEGDGNAWLESVLHNGATGVPELLDTIVAFSSDLEGVCNAASAWLKRNAPTPPANTAKLQEAPKPRVIASREQQWSSGPRYSPYPVAAAATPPHGASNATGTYGQHANWGDRFDGFVKAMKEAKGGKPACGWIESAGAWAVYQDDVFLHSTQTEFLQVGQPVTFSVQVNARGQPQAVDVQVVG
mmetsp:Transcript_105595/g.297092  ORF Transcript_105595/g.297092 Transcript_105595/m.297092 type:complete len:291 (+) Transcript_105595:64-936(+)